jgi:hypothetical protein
MNKMKLSPKLKDCFQNKNREWKKVSGLDKGENILNFDSCFEGENLDDGEFINRGEYSLDMEVDTNTKGNQQWFYLQVTKMKKNQKVIFQINNFTKPFCLFKLGMKISAFFPK